MAIEAPNGYKFEVYYERRFDSPYRHMLVVELCEVVNPSEEKRPVTSRHLVRRSTQLDYIKAGDPDAGDKVRKEIEELKRDILREIEQERMLRELISAVAAE